MNIPKPTQPKEIGQSDANRRDSPADAPGRHGRIPAVGPLLAGAFLALAAAAAGIVWLVLPHNGHPAAGGHTTARPTVPVGYTVTGHGTAEITYTRPDGTSRTVTTHLPWHQTTTLPDTRPATISIVLGPDGGTATCGLTLHGTAVQHATAYGTYGRATCTDAAPAH